MLKTLLVSVFLVFVACGFTHATQLADNSPITCTYDDISKVSTSVLTLSSTELTNICTEIEHSLGHAPNFGLVRKLGQVISLMQIKGNTTTPKDLAYQIMIIAEKRGQLKNEKAMINTFEILHKISYGSNGRVTPKDIIEGMQGMKRTTIKKLSDDGLINLGAMISSNKRDRGE